MSVEIIRYKELNKGATRGFADVRIPEWKLEIYGVTIFTKEGRSWASMPSRMVEQDGEKKYFSHVRFCDKGVADAFGKAVIAAVDAMPKEEPAPQPCMADEDVPF